MEELIDVLDQYGNRTGIVKTKKEIKRDGDYHRAIAVLITNGKEILIQKRSPNKRFYANMWSIFVKGHVQAGETPIEACIREIKEEIGIDINEDELKYLYTLKEEKSDNDYIENIFYDTYLLARDIKLKDIIVQEEEVADAKYISIEEAKKRTRENDGTFAPNEEDYKRIFDYLKKD